MQDSTDPRPEMPSLAKPFAAFGAAAGLFAVLSLGAYREAARDVSPIVPLVVTAGAGAAVGVILRAWRRLHSQDLAREAVVLWVAVLTAAAGAASGGTIGFATWGPDGIVRFALGGAATGLVFTPSCLVVFEAARRAGRGRHGSLVAETDRRTVLSTVLAGVAFAAATPVPAILAAQTSTRLPPLVQVALSILVCLGATAAIVALGRRDRAARATLDGFAKDAAWLERACEAEHEGSAGTPPVDLGVGAEQWTRPDADYRSSGRAGVLVKGSLSDAVAAFEECARRRHRSLVVAACGLTAVTVSFGLRLSVFL